MEFMQRSKLALSTIIALLSGGAGIADQVRLRRAPTRGPARRRAYGRHSANKFGPGEYSERECVRRLGGEDLRRYRAEDRRRRGLPAAK